MQLSEYIKILQGIIAEHGDLPVYATAMGETYDPGFPEMAYRYERPKGPPGVVTYMTRFEDSVYSSIGENDPAVTEYFEGAVFKEKCALVAGR